MSRLGTVLLVVALGVGACKKKVPDPPPPPPVPVQKVEVKLQITSIAPSSVEANTPTSAKVYGSGFKTGATVKLGDRAAASATVVDPNTIDVGIPALQPGGYDVTVTNSSGESTTLRQGLTVRGDTGPDCRLTTVYFDFDQASLRTDGRNQLNANIQCYQQATGSIRIAGHADERGTTDYNLALGQRRAETVKKHLTSQGIAGGRVQTVSYGEERPADRGHSEAAWAKNRRAEVQAE
ncbi:MAG: OmpA family protein [Alphaproteobacteria bacterium]|nr:OmpA family protein [Alphaproteobacteria bacterium]